MSKNQSKISTADEQKRLMTIEQKIQDALRESKYSM